MCREGCNHWFVSEEIIDGQVIETCKDCGKSKKVPGTMTAVMNYMRSKKEFKSRVDYINKFYSRVMG
jgi:hypothetical protein